MMSLNGREMNGNGSQHAEEGLDNNLSHIARDKRYFLEEAAQILKISKKTIDRWRKIGLQSSKEGEQKISITGKAMIEFAASHPQLVERGKRFSRMSPGEAQRIIDLARNEANTGKTRAEVCKRVADITERSYETIRTILKSHDQKHPEHAIFNRTKKTVNQVRYEQIKEKNIAFVPSDEFEKPKADEKFLCDMPEPERPIRMNKAPKDDPAYIQDLYKTSPLLTTKQEVHLFRQYNYLKYKASQLLETMDAKKPNTKTLNEIELLMKAAASVKNHIVTANVRLVVARVKKYANPSDDFMELVSDGNVSLMKAVEKFDYTLGFKFSTYASWAILKNSIRNYSQRKKRTDRTVEMNLDAVADGRSNGRAEEAKHQDAKSAVQELMESLPEREKKIINLRYGLGGAGKEVKEPLTLKEVGAEFGVTKERVRQLQTRAIEMLQRAAIGATRGKIKELLDDFRLDPVQE